MHLRGWELATLSFDRNKIAHTLLGRSCILYFETFLGMNKITPTPSHLLKKCTQGGGFATVSFNRNNMAHCLLGRICYKSLNKIKTILPLLPP